MRLPVDRRANPCGDIGARRAGDGEQLLCEFQGARERNNDGLRSDLVARKVVPRFERRVLDRPFRNGSLETSELVLAQNDLDHGSPRREGVRGSRISKGKDFSLVEDRDTAPDVTRLKAGDHASS